MGDKIPTISITVDEKPRRHSHQPKSFTPPGNHLMRRTNSMEKGNLPETDFRRSNEDLRRSNEDLRRSNEDLRSHDFKRRSNEDLRRNHDEVKRNNSLEKNRRSAQLSNLKKPTEPDIPEADQSEDETVEPPIGKNENNLRVSFTKNNRKISGVSKSSKISTDRGFANEAYDQSNGSSLHGSVASLP